ncbi:unnamed protein product [Discosporangium mesarthrocarpum]
MATDPAVIRNPSCSSAGSGSGAASPGGGGGEAAPPGARLGDKLIGSAVVGLEVLRAAAGLGDTGGPGTAPRVRTGAGLQEINGWYHVLDDMQRTQGQLKVCVRPHLYGPHLAPPSPPETLGLQGPFSHALQGASAGLSLSGGSDRGYGGFHAEELSETAAVAQGDPGEGLDKSVSVTRQGRAEGSTESRPTASDSVNGKVGPEILRALALVPPSFAEQQLECGDVQVIAVSQSLGEALGDNAHESGATSSLAGVESIRSISDVREEESLGLNDLRRMVMSLDRVDRKLDALGASTPNLNPTEETPEGEAQSGLGSGLGDDHGAHAVAWVGGVESDSNGGGTVEEGRLLSGSSLAPGIAVQGRVSGTHSGRELGLGLEEHRHVAALLIQAAFRKARTSRATRAAAAERRRWERQREKRDEEARACGVIQSVWRMHQRRQEEKKELADLRARVAAAARARARAEAVTLLQSAWRGKLARTVAERRWAVRRCQGESGDRGHDYASAATPKALLGKDKALMNLTFNARLGPSPSTPGTPAVLSDTLHAQPSSTFYNQLSQDPRRTHPLPDAHVAKQDHGQQQAVTHRRGPELATTLEPVKREDGQASWCPPPLAVKYSTRGGVQMGSRRGVGVLRTPRFADSETARIARIMKGNLQPRRSARPHWEGGYSSEDV